MSTNGKMEENNKPTVPETISTGTGSGSQASTPSPLASVTTKNEPRIFYFEEIIVSPTANNCVKGKGTSPSNLTRLESISNVPTSDIGVVEIRQFISNNRNRIAVSQKASKKTICDAIALAWSKYETDIKIHGKDLNEAGLIKCIDLTSALDKRSPKVNLFRFTNVLFGERIRPFLMERGGDLTKEDLDVGQKKDQKLYEMLMREYNDTSITAYGESAFPRIWTSSKLGISDNFETISCSADMKTPYHDLLKNATIWNA
jgi:hypothetical protein